MAWSLFFIALALMLVFEGILPFLSPSVWRQMMQYLLQQNDRSLRVMGLLSMLLGVSLIYIIHYFF